MEIKKLIALATTALVGATIFSGCSNTATSKNSDVVTLKWYTIGAEPKDLQLVEDEANKYLEEKIGVNIDMNFIDYGEYSQKLGVIIN